MNSLFDRKICSYLLLSTVLLSLLLSSCSQSPKTESPSSQDTRRTAQESRKSERYDLERDESRGGHTLSRHVARTDEQLKERLRKERNISAASTWTDRQTAEETVATALRAERGRIERWIRRGERRPNLALHFDAGHPVGRSLRRGDTEAVTCTSAVIALRANGADSFYVLTTYPEARE